MFLTCSWVTADLAAVIFHIYAGNRLRADDSSAFVGFKQTKSPLFSYQGLIMCLVTALGLWLPFHLLCVCCWRAGDGLPLLQLADGIGTHS